jgi:hypothetical protein
MGKKKKLKRKPKLKTQGKTRHNTLVLLNSSAQTHSTASSATNSDKSLPSVLAAVFQ